MTDLSTQPPAAPKPVEALPDVTILFAGDSGDGMQVTGSKFTLATALARNDLATLPDFPAEIRAPAGTRYGVSGFQLHFGQTSVRTPGDEVDLLVVMNPAALVVNLQRLHRDATIIVNSDGFSKRDLGLAKLNSNPLEDGTLDKYRVIQVPLTTLTREALKDSGLGQKDVDRSKNMFALGLTIWLYSRPIAPAQEWLRAKFAKVPEIRDANLHVLNKGYHYGETTEAFVVRYEVRPADLEHGTYRAIRGATALAWGLVAASAKAKLPAFYGTYPITPASDLLHELAKHANFGVTTFQAEDEIAAIGSALGASFGGSLGITGTSGPGLALKGETLGLAVMTELPLVVVNVQRGGPSTGLPTKTEQSDLLQTLYGRNGEAPVPVVAAKSPGDCFFAAYEACRIAVEHMTPVVLLSDGYLANGSEPWSIPDPDALAPIRLPFAHEANAEVDGEPAFLPYVRDAETLARPWARPGAKGLEHRLGGLEKQHETGNVSYDAANHQFMVALRAEKVERIARDIPPTGVFGAQSGEVLVLGWGGTHGAIEAAVERSCAGGAKVGHVHLRYLNPLPPDLGEVLARFDRVLVPELNAGQLVRVMRERFAERGIRFTAYNKIQGLPFRADELQAQIEAVLAGDTDDALAPVRTA